MTALARWMHRIAHLLFLNRVRMEFDNSGRLTKRWEVCVACGQRKFIGNMDPWGGE